MTPEQLETAARKLCKLRGIDPDKRVGLPAQVGPVSYDVLDYAPRWKIEAQEIENFLQLREATRI